VRERGRQTEKDERKRGKEEEEARRGRSVTNVLVLGVDNQSLAKWPKCIP
jgi:hypothetical protein